MEKTSLFFYDLFTFSRLVHFAVDHLGSSIDEYLLCCCFPTEKLRISYPHNNLVNEKYTEKNVPVKRVMPRQNPSLNQLYIFVI